jgi:hypothetical protein
MSLRNLTPAPATRSAIVCPGEEDILQVAVPALRACSASTDAGMSRRHLGLIRRDHRAGIARTPEAGEVIDPFEAAKREVALSKDLAASVAADLKQYQRWLRDALENGEELFFRVFISYRGPFTSDHVISACWRYLPDNNHFVQYGHREYNFVR